jgi:formate hydrogenlyase subunit 4
MLGVLSASGALWILHDLFDLTPKAILVVCALATVLFVFVTVFASEPLRKRMMLLVRHAFRSTEQLFARCAVINFGCAWAISNQASFVRLSTSRRFPGKTAQSIALLIAVFTAIHYVAITKIIQNAAWEFDIPYHQTTLPKMIASHCRFLRKMGQGEEATNPVDTAEPQTA